MCRVDINQKPVTNTMVRDIVAKLVETEAAEWSVHQEVWVFFLTNKI